MNVFRDGGLTQRLPPFFSQGRYFEIYTWEGHHIAENKFSTSRTHDNIFPAGLRSGLYK